MREKLVFFAVACLVALPLFAASSTPVQHQAAVSKAPAQDQAVAPAPVVCDQQAVAPVATSGAAAPLALDVSPVTSQLIGSCTTNDDCTNYCLQRYGSPFGRCINFRCTCIF